MDYGNLLKRSWDIVWNNKFMFVLGFLAALGSGGVRGGGGNSGYNFGSGDVPAGTIEQMQQFWTQYGALVISLVFVAIIIGIILWLVRLTAQIGMIEAVSRIEAGEKMTFGEAFAVGTSKLGRMVGINVVMYGPFTLFGLLVFGGFAVMVIAAIGADVSGASGTDIEAIFGSLGFLGICMAFLACLLGPLWIFVTAIYPFAQRGAVLQDLGVADSIRHGWQVVKANAGDVILLILLFIVLGVVFGFAVLIVMIPFALATLGPGIAAVAMGGGSFGVGQIALLAGGGICLGLVGAAVNSILTAFRSTAITLAYQEFISKKV